VYWVQVFQGDRMTAALLDRLTHRCHILEMNGESYRFRGSMKTKKPPSRANEHGAGDARHRPRPEAASEQLRLAGMLIDAAGGAVDWGAYRDQAAQDLRALLDLKLQGQPAAVPEPDHMVLPLLVALQQSVAAAQADDGAAPSSSHTVFRRAMVEADNPCGPSKAAIVFRFTRVSIFLSIFSKQMLDFSRLLW
jgi:hypothetical protein